jgi:hypothetical protein
MFDDTRGGGGDDGGGFWLGPLGPFESRNYVLDGHTPRREPDLLKWAMWFEQADRRVAHHKLKGLWISTVFLGIDHNWGDGAPVLFETAIFDARGGVLSMHRACTWADAVKSHGLALLSVRTFRRGRAMARLSHETRAELRELLSTVP